MRWFNDEAAAGWQLLRCLYLLEISHSSLRLEQI